MKRAFDLVFSLIGLVILFPFLLVISLWIRLDSRGPAIFRQERVGRLGIPFYIHKFRTMVSSADLPGAQLTVEHDRRITRAGRYLRRYKLDELPQLIDVLKGDMSLVGPRPELSKYVAHYPEDARLVILSMRPGITDLASIEFKDENRLLASVPDPEQYYIKEILPRKVRCYLEYVQRRSLWSDFVIVLRTIRAATLR